MTHSAKLSVIVTLRDELGTLSALYGKIVDAIARIGVTAEVIFVDDGSTDGTSVALEDISMRDSAVRVIRFSKSRGQHKAIEEGIRRAKGELIVTMDGDLQNDPGDIPRLVRRIEKGCDVVCGWRTARKDHPAKVIKSYVGNAAQRIITRVAVHDMSCSLRAYRSHIVKGITLRRRHDIGLIPVILSRRRARISEIRVRHRPRSYGKSKYRFFDTVVGVTVSYLGMLTFARPRGGG